MSETPTRPVPCTTDHDTGGFWEAAARGELAVLHCVDCGQALHLPQPYCFSCGGWNTEWRAHPPEGVLYTWTTTERQLWPGFPAPYTVVCVELEGVTPVRLVGYLPGRPELKIGMSMTAIFEEIGEVVVLPQWRPVAEL
jgi:uncharacterized OB-fold protein